MTTYAETLTQEYGIPQKKAEHVSTVFSANPPPGLDRETLERFFTDFSDVVAANPAIAQRLLLVGASQVIFLDAGPDDASTLLAASQSVLSNPENSNGIQGFQRDQSFAYFQETFEPSLTNQPSVIEIFTRRPDLDQQTWLLSVYGMCLAATGYDDISA